MRFASHGFVISVDSLASRIALEVIITARLFLARSTPLRGPSVIRKPRNDVCTRMYLAISAVQNWVE